MSRRVLLIGLVLGLLVALALVLPRERAAGRDDSPLVVLAASSLTESLQRVGSAWTAKGHPKVNLSFDASSRLARQVEAGGLADAFFSADAAWMDYLADKALIDPATRVSLLGNSLVAVLPSASTLAPLSAADLSDPAIRRLALAGDNVPAGKYARAALLNLGVWSAVQDRVVSGDNVRAVLSWVAAGEADAGVVYSTDAAVEPAVKVAFRIPEGSYPQIVYPAAVLKGSARAKDAAEFLAFCQSGEGMAIFTAAGFTAAP